MKRNWSRTIVTVCLLLATHHPAWSSTVTVTFDRFPDGLQIPDSTSITTQFSGLTFANTTVLTSEISLNEFPPHSGINAAFDDGGPISIFFSSQILTFGGYFNYAEPLTIKAFGSGGGLLGSARSQFSDQPGPCRSATQRTERVRPGAH